MKTYKVIFTNWNGYKCSCCTNTIKFEKHYQEKNYESFLESVKKDVKKYYTNNKKEEYYGDIVDFHSFYEITNNGQTQTILNSEQFEKELEDLRKKVDSILEKQEIRKRKNKIKTAIKNIEKKIQENALQKEAAALKIELSKL